MSEVKIPWAAESVKWRYLKIKSMMYFSLKGSQTHKHSLFYWTAEKVERKSDVSIPKITMQSTDTVF